MFQVSFYHCHSYGLTCWCVSSWLDLHTPVVLHIISCCYLILCVDEMWPIPILWMDVKWSASTCWADYGCKRMLVMSIINGICRPVAFWLVLERVLFLITYGPSWVCRWSNLLFIHDEPFLWTGLVRRNSGWLWVSLILLQSWH